MAEILTEPVSAPDVWRGDEIAGAGDWVIRFTEDDFADFERALAHVAAKHPTNVTEIRAEDFPLPHFRQRIDDIVKRLEHGPGLVLLRGLPIYDRFSVDEATMIYWGMGRHMGSLVPQNRKGDLIGQIRDLGRRGPYERAYATNEDLGFHTDSTDFVGPLCFGGALSATVRTGRAMSAMRFPEVPRLTAEEVSCFLYFESLPKRPGVALGMQLQAGDVQFLSNFVTVHNRTAFADDPEDPARQRHLLRLWISRPQAGLPLCPEYAIWRHGYPTRS